MGVSLASDVPLANDPFPPAYHSFLTSPEAPFPPDPLRIRLRAGLPESSGWGALSFSASPWRLFRDGDIRRIVRDGAPGGQVSWLAEFVPDVPEVTVFCGPARVEGEGSERRLRNPMRYPLDQLLMMYYLVGRGQVIVHSAGLILGGRSIVAAGRSGAGKSTLSRCWAARHGDGSLLSDDRVIVGMASADGDGAHAYGTPWPGELGVARNDHRPLGALVFLVQAPVNRLVPLDSRTALERLFPVTSILWFDPDYMGAALAGMEKWVNATPAYEFQFTPDEDAVRALETLDG